MIALLTLVPAAALIHAERTRGYRQTTTSLKSAEGEPRLPRARAA